MGRSNSGTTALPPLSTGGHTPSYPTGRDPKPKAESAGRRPSSGFTAGSGRSSASVARGPCQCSPLLSLDGLPPAPPRLGTNGISCGCRDRDSCGRGSRIERATALLRPGGSSDVADSVNAGTTPPPPLPTDDPSPHALFDAATSSPDAECSPHAAPDRLGRDSDAALAPSRSSRPPPSPSPLLPYPTAAPAPAPSPPPPPPPSSLPPSPPPLPPPSRSRRYRSAAPEPRRTTRASR